MSLSQQSSGYLARPRADQVKFKSPPTYRRTDREVDADLAALTREGAQETAYPTRSLQSLGSPSERKVWHSKDCPAGEKYVPDRRIQDRGKWKTPFPPYAIDLTKPATCKDPVVEEILSATSPPPVTKVVHHGGKPVVKIGREAAHPAVPRKNALGGFFTG